MNIEFGASVALVAPDPPESRRLYVDTLGLPLKQTDGEYFSSEGVILGISFAPWLHK